MAGWVSRVKNDAPSTLPDSTVGDAGANLSGDLEELQDELSGSSSHNTDLGAVRSEPAGVDAKAESTGGRINVPVPQGALCQVKFSTRANRCVRFYYDDDAAVGEIEVLSAEEPEESGPDEFTTETTYHRYHEGEDCDGGRTLKFEILPDVYQRMIAASIDPVTAPDDVLARYAELRPRENCAP